MEVEGQTSLPGPAALDAAQGAAGFLIYLSKGN